jgi:hypothetical protein
VTPTDDDLLRAVAGLYDDLDPAPDDLADGVLARLAVQGLETEYELLTLVERIDATAGTRSSAEAETTATVALEFAGMSYRVLVRISTVDDRRRLDGWVLPAAPLRVLLGHSGDAAADRQNATADRDGRFEFAAAPTGEVRLWLEPQAEGDASVPPFVTPPFLV